MTRRIPASFWAAAQRVLEKLGVEHAARLTGRSSSLVYKWENPALTLHPTVEQALKLDAAYVNGRHGAPPYLTSYTIQLRECTAAAPTSEDLLSEAVGLVNLSTKVLSEVAARAQQPQPPPETLIDTLRRIAEGAATLRWKLLSDTAEAKTPGADVTECPHL